MPYLVGSPFKGEDCSASWFSTFNISGHFQGAHWVNSVFFSLIRSVFRVCELICYSAAL